MSNTSENVDECPICNEESTKLYQCCPNKSDSCCETCWSKFISSVIDTGNVTSLLTGKLACHYCHEPIDRNSLPEKIQIRLNSILSTIPKTKNPKSIEDFNYSYSNSNELRNRLTNDKFIFLTQRYYNLLGGCVDTYIQSLMKSDRWNYQEIWLPIKDEPTDDHSDQVNIFTSSDFNTNENGCLILLQGSGVVRPGQWARSCCINDSLDIGSMFPYMTKAKEHNLSVIILNPNQTSYVEKASVDTDDDTASVNKNETSASEDANSSNKTEDIVVTNSTSTDKESKSTEEKLSATSDDKNKRDENSIDDDIISFYLSANPLPRQITKKIPNLSTNREHVLYVYDHIITKCPAAKFYIVAHSAGGDGLMYLLRKRHDKILPKPSKIAFTDSVHSVLPLESNEIKSFLKSNAIHFIASDEPMGAPIDYVYDFSQGPACQEVSAGHPKHEYTSGHAVQGVFNFFFPIDKTNDDDDDDDNIDRTKL
ncbi:unnamed protein product [Rotaria magnacalcarata]|uniref:Arb2 domain-containing protein n=1 Tax=Rotaria magnacalcarata TaxID=392030 RepID=A0A819KRT8_9BILA|nr:unnamed protein product [Rotaria magnacalcarata]CAF3949637.1 unnamed protein product [Rotaria magnacalcarata]